MLRISRLASFFAFSLWHQSLCCPEEHPERVIGGFVSAFFLMQSPSRHRRQVHPTPFTVALFRTFSPSAPVALLSRGTPNACLDDPTAANDPQIRHIETLSHILRTRHGGELAHHRRVRYSRYYERGHSAAAAATEASRPYRIRNVKEPKAILFQPKYAPDAMASRGYFRNPNPQKN